MLDRLLRDGLVTRRAVPQVDRPDKWMYRLTEAGQAELERWLATPFVRQSGYRDDFFLKLVAAARLGPDSRRTLFRVQRAAVFHTEANLKVLERAEHLGDALVPAAEDASISTATEQREAG